LGCHSRPQIEIVGFQFNQLRMGGIALLNEGTLRLDIPTTASVTDMVGNPLAGLPYTTGEWYTVLTDIYIYLPMVVRDAP